MTIPTIASGNINTVMSEDLSLQNQHDSIISKPFNDNESMQKEVGGLLASLRENAFNSDNHSINFLIKIASKPEINCEPDLAAKAACDILQDLQNKSEVDSHRFNTLQNAATQAYQIAKQNNTEETLPRPVLELALNAALANEDDATVIAILDLLAPVKQQSIPNALEPIDVRNLSAEELDRAVVYVPTEHAVLSHQEAKILYHDQVLESIQTLEGKLKPESWIQKMVDKLMSKWEQKNPVENFEQTQPIVKAAPKAIEYSPLQAQLAKQNPIPHQTVHAESPHLEMEYDLMVGEPSIPVKSESSSKSQEKYSYNPLNLMAGGARNIASGANAFWSAITGKQS
ncbi:hypothetical protein [uncultured Shewanella sp.]|uniref:hypothetical protein n=1 Tax=uncultured Shewanella sp. TaxID=173975 RepID=UPI002608B1A7|nr:hypothetical protein [uncultured Shewanella sp.]